MSRLPDLYARISPRVAHSRGALIASRTHARVMRCSGGRLGRRVLGADVLLIRTTGARTGQTRTSPVFFLSHAGGFAVVASNAASPRFPAWWHNLQADCDCELFLGGVWLGARARPAGEPEIAELWPRFVASYSGYEHYESISERQLPVVILEPRDP